MKSSLSFTEVLALLAIALFLPYISGLSSSSSSSLSMSTLAEKLPTTSVKNVTFHQYLEPGRHAVDKNNVDDTSSSSILRILVADSLTASHDIFSPSDSSSIETSDVISPALSPPSSYFAGVEPSSSSIPSMHRLSRAGVAPSSHRAPSAELSISQVRTISLVPTSSDETLSFLDAITETVLSIVDTAVGFVSSITEDPSLDTVTDTLSNITDLISEDPTLDIVTDTLSNIKEVVGPGVDTFTDVISNITEMVGPAADIVTDVLSNFTDRLGPGVDAVTDTISNITEVVLELGSSIFDNSTASNNTLYIVDTIADTILSITELVLEFMSTTTFFGVVSVVVAGGLAVFIVAVVGGLCGLGLILIPCII